MKKRDTAPAKAAGTASRTAPSKARRRLRLVLCILVGVLCALLLTVWFLTACPWGLFRARNPYATGGAPPSFTRDGTVYQYNPDIYNVLVLGVDVGNGDETDLLAGQADVILLASLNKKTGELFLLSIPRDTFVPVRSYNQFGEQLFTFEGPICTAYAYGDGSLSSGQMMMSAVSELLYNIPIEHFVSVSIESIGWLTDFVGGVPVSEYGEFAAYWDLPEDGSPLLLHGEIAEIYVRARSLEGMDGTDQSRMRRQQEYLSALLQILKENTGANPLYPLKLYRGARAATDVFTNLSPRELCFFGSGAARAAITSQSLPGETVPCDTGQAEVQFVPDEIALRTYIQEIYFAPA